MSRTRLTPEPEGRAFPKDNNEPIVTNTSGGMGSKLSVAYHLIPNKVLKALAEVYNYGAYIRPYGPWNWRKVTWFDHYNHLENHLQNVRAEMGKNKPDEKYIEDEAKHALCRMTMMFSKLVGIDDLLVDCRDD